MALLFYILIVNFVTGIKESLTTNLSEDKSMSDYDSLSQRSIPINLNYQLESNSSTKCNRFTCFDHLHCEINERKQLKYYVYPPLNFVDSSNDVIYSTKQAISKEYWELFETMLINPLHTTDPKQACLYVVSTDLYYIAMLNPARLKYDILNSLPYWTLVDGRPGTNHLLIDLHKGFQNDIDVGLIGNAMLASIRHNTWTFRPQFDLSLPVIVQSTNEIRQQMFDRPWYLLVTQYDCVSATQRTSIDNLKIIMGQRLLVLGNKDCNNIKWSSLCSNKNLNNYMNQDEEIDCRCDIFDKREGYKFPNIFGRVKFCLIFDVRDLTRFTNSANYILAEALKYGCVPIISSDIELPFKDLIDWSRFSIRLTNSENLEQIDSLIASISLTKSENMSERAQKIWDDFYIAPDRIATNIMRYYDMLIYPEQILNCEK